MAKKSNKVDSDQLSLLDLLQEKQDSLRSNDVQEGAFDIHTRFCHSLARAVKQSPYNRYEICARMSSALGQDITKTMFDSWTSESKTLNRMPAEFMPAFIYATGVREPMEILTDTAGLFCLPGRDALRAEIQKLTEDEKKIRSEKRKRELFLQEMEG
jgi:hypothetical protein